MTLRQREPRQRDEKHLRLVRQLPCIICGYSPVDAAHIRMTAPGKFNPGVGMKPHDRYTVPLCRRHHTEQHATSERLFWERHLKDPLSIAARLYEVSGDLGAMERVVRES